MRYDMINHTAWEEDAGQHDRLVAAYENETPAKTICVKMKQDATPEENASARQQIAEELKPYAGLVPIIDAGYNMDDFTNNEFTVRVRLYKPLPEPV